MAEAELRKAEEDKQNGVVPLTEQELAAKKAATEKIEQKQRKGAEKAAMSCYDELRISAESLELDLANKGLLPEDAKKIASLLVWQGLDLRKAGSLYYLVLRSNPIGLKGTKYICQALNFDVNRVLLYLDLSENGLGTEGAKIIASMLKVNKSLLELRLKYCHLGSKGMEHLSEALPHNHCLESLSLKGNNILNEGCAALAKTKFGNILFLDIRDNGFNDMGCFALADGLTDNFCIQGLNIRENCWGDEGRWALGNALRNNRRAYFKGQSKLRTELQEKYVKPSLDQVKLALPMVDFYGIVVEPQPLFIKYVWNCTETNSVMRYRHHNKWGCEVS